MITTLICLTIAFICALFHFQGAYFPVEVSILLIFGLFARGFIWDSRLSRIGFAPRLLLLAYLAPSFVFIEEIFFDSVAYSEITRATAHLTSDPVMVNFVAMLHLIGMAGLVAGIAFKRFRSLSWTERFGDPAIDFLRRSRFRPNQGMSFFLFAVLICVPTVLYLGMTASGSIMDMDYKYARTQAGAFAGFAFAGIVPLVFMTYAICVYDWMQERGTKHNKQKLKTAALSLGTLSIIIWDLKGGERTMANLLLFLLGVVLLSPFLTQRIKNLKLILMRFRKKLLVFSIGAAAAFFLMLLIQDARRSLHTGFYSFETFVTERLPRFYKAGTWQGAFFGSFGLAEEYLGRYGGEDYPYRMGHTYMGFLLSSLPSPISRPLGIERPFDRQENRPNGWFAHYSNGGVHPTLVPFTNFTVFFVPFALMAYGYFGAWVEERLRLGALFPFLLWAAVVQSSVRWFWYGEMNLVRGLMAAVIVYYVYKGIMRLEGKTVQPLPTWLLRPSN